MGVPINRLHSERAKELISKQVEAWCARMGVAQATTGGDDPAANGHVEPAVNQVKRRRGFSWDNMGAACRCGQQPCATLWRWRGVCANSGGFFPPSSSRSLTTRPAGAAVPGGATAGGGSTGPGGADIWKDDPLAIPISTISSSSKGLRGLRLGERDEGGDGATVDAVPPYQKGRWLPISVVEGAWGDQQGCIQEQVLGCINAVPVTEDQGAAQGELMQNLLGWRDEVEGQLVDLAGVDKLHKIRVGAMQAQQQEKEEETVLQTVTVPLSEVRANAQDWIPAFEYEYNLLVKDTGAVVPTQRHLLAPGTELVRGKAVRCKKGGSGLLRARAVICGNLVSPAAPPSCKLLDLCNRVVSLWRYSHQG